MTITGQVMADASVGTMAHIAGRVNGATEVINMIRTLPVSPQDDAIRHEIGLKQSVASTCICTGMLF